MEITIELILLAAVIVLLISGKISFLGSTVLILGTLTGFGIIAPQETFAELANPTITLYVGSFMVGAAFSKVHLTELIGRRAMTILTRFAAHEGLTLFVISILTAFLSIFLQALGVQIALLTILLSIADQLHINRKKILLALGFSATIGSTFTLLGNNVNLLAKATYESAVPGAVWGAFELTILTVPLGLLLMAVFCFITSRWIRPSQESENQTPEIAKANTNAIEQVPRSKQYAAVLISSCFLIAVLLDGKLPIPTNVVVLFCMTALVLTKVMTAEEVLGAIQWPIILFTAAVLTFSSSLMDAGAGDYIASITKNLLGNQASLRELVAIVLIISTISTQFLSNSGTFAIIAPLAISLAQELSLPVLPVVVAICLASTLAFLTPFSAPSFPMLAAAGKISFKEFFLQGLVLTILCTVLCIIFIPIIWS